MGDNYILLSLVFVVILIISIYYIYQSAKKNKEEQEKIDREYAEYEKRQEKLRIKERQEESIKWNNKIQDKFTQKVKYKTNRPIKALIGDYTNSMAPLTNSIIRTMGIQTEIVPTASDIIDRIKDGNKYDIIITNNVYPKGESGQMVLDTLKEETIAEGMAEVIKYGVIFDKELFDSVKDGNVKDIIDSIIYRCIELKRNVVEIDEHDNGERQLLNFGHTIGHAIEKCSGFSVSHGNAVAMGMMIAAKASFALGFSSEDCAPEIKEALINNRLPVSASFSAEELYEVTLSDKKRRGKTINLIVPEKIGKCFRKEQSTDQILEFIKCGI